MSIEVSTAKHVIHDQFEAQIRSVEAKLETLRAQAEAAKAHAEIKAIKDLLGKKVELGRKVQELKKAGDDKWEHRKAELESLLKSLEKSVAEIEVKVKTH